MATVGRINGDILGIQLNGQLVAVTEECSHSIAVAARETTSKDDLGKYNGAPTKATETLKGSYLVAFDNNMYQTIRALARNKTLFTWRFGSVQSGDPYDQGTGFFTSVDTSAPNNDSVTGSFSIQVTGAVISTTNP